MVKMDLSDLRVGGLLGGFEDVVLVWGEMGMILCA